MPVKKARKSTRSLRYLLYADRKLQRISVRKISERLKKARQARRATRRKSAVAAGSAMHASWLPSTRAIVVGVSCVVAAVALVAAGQPDPRSDAARGDVPEAFAPLENNRLPARADTAGVPIRTRPARKPAEASVAQPARPRTAEAKAVEAKVEADTPKVQPVTITGCLDQDDNTFWLKNTSGADVPKSRSWRSGFIKKGSSSVELVDAANTLRLSNFVGQRVAATGMLADREMRARSLRRVSASCS